MRQLTLSLKQPWALMVVMGLKKCETRSWKTKIRGPVRIYASKSWTGAQIDYLDGLLKGFPQLDEHDEYGEAFWELGHNPMLFGSIIGDVFLDKCTSTNVGGTVACLPQIELAMGNFAPNRFFFDLIKPNFYKTPKLIGDQRPQPTFWYWDDHGHTDFTNR